MGYYKADWTLSRVVAGVVIVAGLAGLVVSEAIGDRPEPLNMEELLDDYEAAFDGLDDKFRDYHGGFSRYKWSLACERESSEECKKRWAWPMDQERQCNCMNSVLGQYDYKPAAERRVPRTILRACTGFKRVGALARAVATIKGIDVSDVQVTDYSLPFRVKWGKGIRCSEQGLRAGA